GQPVGAALRRAGLRGGPRHAAHRVGRRSAVADLAPSAIAERETTMDETTTKPKTARMFNTNWFDPGWHKGNMAAGSNGREEVPGETAGKGEAWAAIFNFGTEECPGRVFISKFEPGAVIHTHDHPNDYCSIIVEGS